MENMWGAIAAGRFKRPGRATWKKRTLIQTNRVEVLSLRELGKHAVVSALPPWPSQSATKLKNLDLYSMCIWFLPLVLNTFKSPFLIICVSCNNSQNGLPDYLCFSAHLKKLISKLLLEISFKNINRAAFLLWLRFLMILQNSQVTLYLLVAVFFESV